LSRGKSNCSTSESHLAFRPGDRHRYTNLEWFAKKTEPVAHEMKTLFLTLCLVGVHSVFAGEITPNDQLSRTLTDPRKAPAFFTMFEDGVAPKTTKLISNSIIIISWMPAPDGRVGIYQIGGLEGYHSKEQVERFLAKFYAADHQKETKKDRPNIVLAGNNWAAGMELADTLGKLSKDKSLGVYYIGGWAFSKVDLLTESEARKKLIEKCYKEANP
jgi:hypothetical protein